MYERFTEPARQVMQLANQEAMRLHHEYIGTEHILLGLIRQGSGVGGCVLKYFDVDLRSIRGEVENLEPAESGRLPPPGRLPQRSGAKEIVKYSFQEALRLNHNYVGTEHLLLALLRNSESTAARILVNLGLKLEDVRKEVLHLLGHDTEGEGDPEDPDETLDRDLVALPHGTTPQDPDHVELPAVCMKCGGSRGVFIFWNRIPFNLKDEQDVEAGRAIVIRDIQSKAPSWACLDCSSGWSEVHRLSLRIDELQAEKEEAIVSREFEKAATVRDSQVELKQQMMTLVKELADC